MKSETMAQPDAEQGDSGGNGQLRMSLVVSTLGRTRELEILLDSLACQTLQPLEVLLVDQNDDERLLPLLKQDRWPFTVRHIRTPCERGLSRGRNRGWRLAKGDVILFPDDDCWYGPNFLDGASKAMMALGCDVLTGRATDENGRSINGRFETRAQQITRANVWTTGIEWVFFFRRHALEAVGGFDEKIGVGASTPWQAAEGQDILLRILEAGFLCWFDPAIAGHHAEIGSAAPDARARRKARAYARGMGYVLRQHRFGFGARAGWIARPLAGAILSLGRGRSKLMRYYGQIALGRLEGMRARTFGQKSG